MSYFFVPKRSASLLRTIILCIVLVFLPTLPVFSQKPLPVAITQRGINEMAAGVEQVRHALIEDAGMRRQGEGLSAYLRRIALSQPGETKARYFARITGYLTLLAQCTEAAKNGRTLPALRDTSETNRAQWERTVRALQLLPARVRKTQAVWQKVQSMYDVAGSAPASVLLKFDVQMEQTAQIIIAASDGLRDARP